MKKVGIMMNLLMGVTMSLCLSLVGNLTSEDGFQLKIFLASFAASTVISLIIGFLIPIRKLEAGAARAMGLNERSLPASAVSAFISDLIYTPVITFAMIVLVRKMVMRMSNGHAVLPPFGAMFFKSLIISFIIAFIIIFIVTPLYLKLSMKFAGIDPAAGGPPADKS